MAWGNDGTMMILRRFARGSAVRVRLTAAVGGTVLALASSGAGAQNVTVDLSVLDDGGVGPRPGVVLPGAIGHRLLMPGARMPVSMLHVAVPGGVSGAVATKTSAPVLTAPSTPLASTLNLPAETPPPPPVVTTPSRPVVTATTAMPPPPPPVAQPEIAEQPAPPPPPPAPKPVKPAVVAAAPPPPPPPAKTEITPKKPAAPMPVVAPPPPPPPPSPTKTTKPAKPTVAVPEKKPEATEQASLPPSGQALTPGVLTKVIFTAEASKLPAAAKKQLKDLAERLKMQKDLRLQLMAFAGKKTLSASKARRLSLSRALSVRSFLIENGVRSTRIDVRALGNKTTEEPPDRVDVIVVKR
jgi:outer membrane protein OmpA-like peptidoglycan-associated protein